MNLKNFSMPQKIRLEQHQESKKKNFQDEELPHELLLTARQKRLMKK